MEYVGREPIGARYYSRPGYAGAGGKSRWFRQDFDVADDWHTYAIEWDETGISWFFMVRSSPPLVRRTLSAVNGCLTGRSLCWNLAIGGTLKGTLIQTLNSRCGMQTTCVPTNEGEVFHWGIGSEY